MGYNDPRICDVLLIALSVFLVTGGKLLNIEKWMPTRSRFDVGGVVGFVVNLGKIDVDRYDPNFVFQDARVRPAFSCSLTPSGAKA